MKETIRIISIVTSGVIAFMFIGYALVGFISWIASDPFNWVSTTYVEPTEYQICRDNGGIPIRSAWDGRVKRCDIITNQ